MRKTALSILLILWAASLGAAAMEWLSVCSFDIHDLGYYEEKDVRALAHTLSAYDIVAIQGIVAPPYAGTFPDGEPYVPEPSVAAFFDEMTVRWGYAYILSEEDTGKRLIHHSNEPWTEWFALFYDPAKLEPASPLPRGFLAEDRTANPVYDWVPYAFPLRHLGTGFDFVVVSVRLHEGSAEQDRAKRASELEAIAAWIRGQLTAETEFLIVGNMGFADCAEILAGVPSDLRFLNPDHTGACHMTDAAPQPRSPADAILFVRRVQVDHVFGLRVIDLYRGLAAIWNPDGDPIEAAYADRRFAARISDRNPVVVRFQTASGDYD